MKLSAHYNKASIIVSVIVLLVGAVIYFFAINFIAQNQLDRDLDEEIEELFEYINTNHQLPKADFNGDQTTFLKVNHGINTRFFDALYQNPREQKSENGRAAEGSVVLNGVTYKFTIVISRESTEYLIQIIAIITLVLMACLVLILFLTNRYVLNGLWQPFYRLLNQLKDFNVSENSEHQLLTTRVDEFNELDQAIEIMSLRVKDDFQNLKAFTENASHEMMTPLAVITSKLDTLIQDETLKPEQFEQINDIYGATSKLSRLNHSLLLLVKIENNLIDDTEVIDLTKLLRDKLRQFQELTQTKELNVIANLISRKVIVSKYLVDILFNNLISNAIRHNNNKGVLIVTLFEDVLLIQNTGSPNALNAERIFDRFQKGKKSEGTGLGLTIVKNICKMYGWEVAYSYHESMHTFEIVFEPSTVL
ncbi:sensor histidine kinase [Mucilaginibacter jinjuensis]|uniref:histidine kinase n=1 Tax=Mucilaginibacter jinjuensis TaxID=1176721 RepID=A0ABY7TDT4_9SPHI|nr:HAMP domain-containing sensor histidine kinase [Mucilaginibacter jinjuensis]WCT14304.1 HAMP domain-containing sensor histidine kinase [Mucilaginibacter jinjuensis]